MQHTAHVCPDDGLIASDSDPKCGCLPPANILPIYTTKLVSKLSRIMETYMFDLDMLVEIRNSCIYSRADDLIGELSIR